MATHSRSSFGRHAGRGYRIAYRFVRDRAEAEDMVQDVFVMLWEKPGLWQEGRGASFSTWLTRILINRAIDVTRRKRFVPLDVAMELAASDLPADEALAVAAASSASMPRSPALPERQRTALHLCFDEGLSNAEAAQIMRVRLKALQSLLMRAKATLKDRLRED
ncbi:MAG: sigma-70 family RNA polymerase sigma factor [Alphaproteobacteria bacterium]